MGNTKAYDVDSIVLESAATQKNQLVEGYDKLVQEFSRESAGGASAERKKLKPLVWEEEPVPVRNPELVDVLLKVQQAEEKLKEMHSDKSVATGEDDKRKGKVGKGTKSKRGVAAYDAILLALSDAEGVARKLVEAQQLSGSTTVTPTGTRDVQFVHAYIVYQLLARRIQRDLLLTSTILHQSQHTSHRNTSKAGPSKPSGNKEHVDARLFPAVVKLLDTIIQSLTQMRTLTVVDDSPDLATVIDARISFTKARRCRYLGRCYVSVKKYSEALTLMQHASLHLRETNSSLSLLPSSADAISASEPAFYVLDPESLAALEEELATESLQCKKDWFNYNGGDVTGTVDRKTHKKPLFFDIALNYVELDMERLQERAGKKAIPAQKLVAPQPQRGPSSTVPRQVEQEKTKNPTSRAKVEEIIRPMTPEPSAAAKGLGGLLGGWWGRK
ncbi:hypothetical protein EW026_g6749 [Hermanssonia centrifuga]|uniref:Signal recognition particle subunit SRP68 n=1 Tax=Hermanssonia centrifuga TaxID=98765 RepID=A0A4S4KBR7_9APHY|nr:hypothetical protein EW026_g6749 [Hermanssonia centrifuga]